MFEEKLIEAEEILKKASIILMKEMYVKSLMEANDICPDISNNDEQFENLLEIQDSILNLRTQIVTIPVS